MGKLIVTEFVTLDGIAQAPGGPDEDRDGGFEHGGWQGPLSDDEAGDVAFEQASSMDALLLGRHTYEIFANYWPTAPADHPFTKLLNGIPKYVASRTLSEPLAWQNSTLVRGDVPAGVGALKERHDEIQVIGSLDLVQSLLRFDLVDRLRLWQYPVLLGAGSACSRRNRAHCAPLIESNTYPSGTLHLTYEPQGSPPTKRWASRTEAALTSGSISSR